MVCRSARLLACLAAAHAFGPPTRRRLPQTKRRADGEKTGLDAIDELVSFTDAVQAACAATPSLLAQAGLAPAQGAATAHRGPAAAVPVWPVRVGCSRQARQKATQLFWSFTTISPLPPKGRK